MYVVVEGWPDSVMVAQSFLLMPKCRDHSKSLKNFSNTLIDSIDVIGILVIILFCLVAFFFSCFLKKGLLF